MGFSRAKFFCCLAALALLWGCEAPKGELQTSSTKNDMPVGSFFRTAAATSQDKFDYQSAAKYYQNLYNRDPNDMQALLGLVRNLRYIGSAGQSVALLEDAMLDNPDIFALRAEHGKALVASGRAEDAIEVLTELLDESPDDWELLSALGIAYDLNDEPDESERAYRAALEITPRNTSIINNLGLSLALSGNINDGIALLEETMINASSTPHIRQNLALMYAMKGDMNSARQLAEQDLPQDMVTSNLRYYERLFSRAGGVQPDEVVEVSRLEESDETGIEPVVPATATESQETTTVAAVEPEQTMATSIEGIKVQLGVFKTHERATAGLSEMRDSNVDLLSGLDFMIDEVEGIDAPVGYMVLAGPLASQQLAADLCTKLHSRKEVCRLVLP